ncbi:helix-turn-helix domain-containing protein [Streptosporangium sandarakinum]
MDGGALYSIGDLARRTGLTVKTIRFYSDRGIVTPTDRSPAGHRRYDIEAAARLDLVCTLRDLGLGLAMIRKVVDRELSLTEVAATHAEALATQISALRLRRAVLTVVAERGATPEEMDLMHKLAKLSENERRRLVDDFLDAVFGGLGADPHFTGIRRSMTPELPDDPGTEQVRAWVELAELSQDPDFRARVRRTAEDHVNERPEGGIAVPRLDIVAAVRDQVRPAMEVGIAPTSPEADPIVSALTAHYAGVVGLPDDVELRRRLLARLETANDPRRQRYLELLAVVNGWPAPEDLTPVLDWSIQALRPQTPPSQTPPSPTAPSPAPGDR